MCTTCWRHFRRATVLCLRPIRWCRRRACPPNEPACRRRCCPRRENRRPAESTGTSGRDRLNQLAVERPFSKYASSVAPEAPASQQSAQIALAGLGVFAVEHAAEEVGGGPHLGFRVG